MKIGVLTEFSCRGEFRVWVFCGFVFDFWLLVMGSGVWAFSRVLKLDGCC